MIKVRSQRFGGDLLSIQVQAQIGQLESLKIEGVPVVASIEALLLTSPMTSLVSESKTNCPARFLNFPKEWQKFSAPPFSVGTWLFPSPALSHEPALPLDSALPCEQTGRRG